MRLSLTRHTKLERALSGKGVIIKPGGRILRLCVSPGRRARIAENRFDEESNTVLGPALSVTDFPSAEKAIERWEKLKAAKGNLWREEERVMYDPTR